MADPTAGLSWLFYDDYIKQTRLMLKANASLKMPYGNFDDKNELKNFSNGYWESSYGGSAILTDMVWSFILDEKVIIRHEHENFNPGLVNKLSFSASYTSIGYGQAMLGIEQELRGPDRRFGRLTGHEGISRYSYNALWSLQNASVIAKLWNFLEVILYPCKKIL